MPLPSDLTTLNAVKAWLSVTDGSSDVVLTSLVSSVSRAIYAMMSRPSILPGSFTEVFDGHGSRSIQLRNYPVISVSALYMGGMSVLQAPALPAYPTSWPGIGWILETTDPTPPGRPAQVYLRGDNFWRGTQNVSISYVAGYQVTSEAQTVSNSLYSVTAAQPFGAWASDRGVTYANGTALTAVTGTPAIVQYAVSGGVYTFAAGDAGAAVLLSYGFIPADLAQACMEWVGYRFKARDRIGQKSKSLGGQETVSFETGRAPDIVFGLVQPFKRVSLGY